MKLSARSYAKVNIGLKIMAKRPDGYHDLDTYFHLIDLYDDIFFDIEDAGQTSVTISGNESYLPQGATDLMEKAALLFSALSGRTFRLEIRIVKRIPSQAGLGGGSSNASTVLRVLNSHYSNPLTQDELMASSLTLGSDVPIFTSTLPCAHASGRGEILEEREGVDAPVLIVIRKGEKVSTGPAFAAVDALGGERKPLPPWTVDISRWASLYTNDFDIIQPILTDEAFLALAEKSVFHSTSGSGAAQLLVFSSEAERDDAARSFAALGSTYNAISSTMCKNITESRVLRC